MWYSVVTFGRPVRPVNAGQRVSKDLDACKTRAWELSREGVPNVRVFKCATRQQARDADISMGKYPIMLSL